MTENGTVGSLLLSAYIAENMGPDLIGVVGAVDFVRVDAEGHHGDLSEVEVAFFSGDCYPDLAAEFMGAVLGSESLQWVHAFHAGIDNPIYGHLLSQGVRVTNSSGANARAVAQGAITGLLALARDLPSSLVDQQNHRWNRRTVEDVTNCHLGVLGMGAIGQHIAKMAMALGMTVTGLRRDPTGYEPCPTVAMNDLEALLPTFDYLVVALPLNDDTSGIIDATVLARLKPGCRIINVGRGPLIDEGSLIDALHSGHLGGAALDVFATEPLPPDSPLWDLPSVIVTPHIAGLTTGLHARAAEMFVENLGRYVRGETLMNEAPSDPAQGSKGEAGDR